MINKSSYIPASVEVNQVDIPSECKEFYQLPLILTALLLIV